VYQINPDTLYICSDRSAHNMSFQDQAEVFGQKKLVCRINGSELIGTPVSSPNCTYERIYALPMESILMTKATGVVTSVPSDAPDDWQNLADLQNNAEWRAKCGVKDEWVLPFKPVPIIRVPELGDLAAKTACEAEGVKSRHDAAALKSAKAKVYNLGFHSGVMLVGK
jgi:leucyl-tRNA synthetase